MFLAGDGFCGDRIAFMRVLYVSDTVLSWAVTGVRVEGYGPWVRGSGFRSAHYKGVGFRAQGFGIPKLRFLHTNIRLTYSSLIVEDCLAGPLCSVSWEVELQP